MEIMTVPDCSLRGRPIKVADWRTMTSETIAEIVGSQAPAGPAEYPDEYEWRFVMMPLEDLRCSDQEYMEPEGGWAETYRKHCRWDALAVAEGSPEYAGRQEWFRDHWTKNTAIYPLFVVLEEDGYRVWDGHHRLAAAFFHGIPEVAVLLGVQKGLTLEFDGPANGTRPSLPTP